MNSSYRLALHPSRTALYINVSFVTIEGAEPRTYKDTNIETERRHGIISEVIQDFSHCRAVKPATLCAVDEILFARLTKDFR